MSPFVKLQIKVMSNDMASPNIGQVVNNLANSPAFAHVAKVKVQEYIETVRSSPDADPNWTDSQICEMILDSISTASSS